MLLGWPDYLCALVIVWGALTGLMRGFVRMVVDLAALVAGVGVAAWGTGPVMGWLGRLGWVGRLETWVSAHLPLPRSVATMPVGGRVPIAWGEGLPPVLKAALQQRAEAVFASTSAVATLGELVARALAELVLSLAVFLLIVAAVQWFLGRAGRKVSQWLGARGLAWPDRMAGLLVGAVRNALLVSALAAFALPLVPMVAPGFIQPGGLTCVLAGWFGRFYPWLLAHL